ncbi:Selenocysteine lyase/Cysteine desulfurase [Arboricoccus pini]|uniref:Selenocysteine lyase/Cysteine desulfurase n=1 Tax=Arboricoccus pini TaxID=1963835 RepID=A0A212RN13_9PROT|nr:aminotransferase class V-fold PLP-dependent enzyme [Arboricoccus pini]SNB73948.1 Selenocysteine lyase/Cysteine desulfurase [Arboricoccus pini]
MNLPIEAIRAATPGVGRRVHLNNAGASLLSSPVLETVIGHLRRESEIGGYEAAAEAAPRFEAIYDSLARLLNATADEVALFSSATTAWQAAFYALSFGPGDRILTARAEYAANYVAFLQVARRTGARIEVIPDDQDGVLDPAALAEMLDERVKLIAITWAPTNGGLVNPAAEVGSVARAHGIPYLLDACQAVGQFPVDVEVIGCDMLTGTGRKFLRGPRGTGFLYVRAGFCHDLEPAMIDHGGAPWKAPDRYELRADARRFETWEKDWAAFLGLGAAIDYALGLGLAGIAERCQHLAGRLRDGLRAVPGITLHDLGPKPSAIVSFTVAGWTADEIMASAGNAGINVNVSRPDSTLLDAQARHLPAVVRASPHYYNNETELDRLLSLLRDLNRRH